MENNFTTEKIKQTKIYCVNTNEVAKVYDSVLSIPGMNELVKLNI